MFTMVKIKARPSKNYWVYQNDTPKSFSKDFKRIFSEDPPA